MSATFLIHTTALLRRSKSNISARFMKNKCKKLSNVSHTWFALFFFFFLQRSIVTRDRSIRFLVFASSFHVYTIRNKWLVCDMHIADAMAAFSREQDAQYVRIFRHSVHALAREDDKTFNRETDLIKNYSPSSHQFAGRFVLPLLTLPLPALISASLRTLGYYPRVLGGSPPARPSNFSLPQAKKEACRI